MEKKKINLKDFKSKGKKKESTIPLNEARQMIINWRASRAYAETGSFNAFHIPKDEINDFFNKYKGEGVGVRAYIGLSDNESATSQNLKLIFVATKLDPLLGDQNKDIIETINGESVVYDLSTPCPYSCDFESPLMSFEEE
jgi:hypothetical protein